MFYLIMFLFGYLFLMNIGGYVSMARDKRKAVKHQYRTPERHLWAVAAFGGVFGSLLGMKIKRHKTQTPVFKYGMPILGVAHILLWSFIFYHL